MTDTNGGARGNVKRLQTGALAATALAVGAGTATAQDDEQVVVSGYHYYPDNDFEVLEQYATSTKNDILETFDDEFADPTDWDAYVIQIDIGGSADALGILFTDQDELDIEAGDTGTFDDSAAFRNDELNLLEVDSGL